MVQHAHDLTINVTDIDTGGEILAHTLDGEAFTGSGSNQQLLAHNQNGKVQAVVGIL